jgi:hypothetical protein
VDEPGARVGHPAQDLIELSLDRRSVAVLAKSLKAGRDPELVELLMIQAEEAIKPNRNRRPIAETCLLLYYVMKLQDRAREAPAGAR